MDEPVEMTIDGTLDLHTFHPRDVKDLVEEYLRECRSRNILEVRVIHGKGKGVLKRTVESLLERLDWVESYQTPDQGRGGWGATIVTLSPP